jgi:hypothetical protein
LVVVALEAKGTVATTTKDERKELGLLLGRDEPEFHDVRCKQAVPDLFRIS